MKTFATAAAAAALLGSVLAAPASTEAQTPPTGIPGFLNPATGTFTARLSFAPSAATLVRTGTITVTINAVINSTIPLSEAITCSVTLFSTDAAATNEVTGSGTLTRSGTKGKCSIKLPYIWEVANAQTPMNVSAAISTTFGTNQPFRSASHTFSPFAVPNGNKALAVALAM